MSEKLVVYENQRKGVVADENHERSGLFNNMIFRNINFLRAAIFFSLLGAMGVMKGCTREDFEISRMKRDGGSISYDGGRFNDGGFRMDGGNSLDGGGNRPDGGPSPDGGPKPDGGAAQDGGGQVDGGNRADGGQCFDGGAQFDGGARPDGGAIVDAGIQIDAGVSKTCSDGNVDENESCDGQNLNGQSCQTFNYDRGELSCNDCKFDFSNCINDSPYCGDGVVDAGETCDGNNLGGKRCQDFGFEGGNLLCTDRCIIKFDECF